MKLTMLALVQIAALPAVHVRAPKRANHPSITCSEPARQRLLEQLENPVAQYRRCRHSGKRARNGRLVSPVIFSRCPCYAEIGPCYFLREISLETLMESAFVDDVAVILAPILRFSPVFSPVIPKNSQWRRVRIRLHPQPGSRSPRVVIRAALSCPAARKRCEPRTCAHAA
jgi:hypothetical protein